jgi:hypothetical protein
MGLKAKIAERLFSTRLRVSREPWQWDALTDEEFLNILDDEMLDQRNDARNDGYSSGVDAERYSRD